MFGSGDRQNVNREFIAAAYHQAAQDRLGGRPLDAAAVTDLLATRFPDHLEVQLAQVESTIVDRADPQTALNRLGGLNVPQPETRARIRAGLLRASALEAMKDTSAARQVLETLRTEFPANGEIQRRLSALARP